jgi:predicted transposase YdaD
MGNLLSLISIDTIESAATIIAVIIAAMAIRQHNQLALAKYEEDFDKQYRELAMIIPMDVFLGIKNETVTPEVREAIFNYFDLTNEQIYQRIKGRISKDTWDDWCAGINDNMKCPEIHNLWLEVLEKAPGRFTHLELFMDTEQFVKHQNKQRGNNV